MNITGHDLILACSAIGAGLAVIAGIGPGVGPVSYTHLTYGFAPGILNEVKTTADCQGEIYLLKWDADTCQPEQFIYIEKGYLVTYQKVNNENQWDVSKLNHLIDGS